MPHLTCDAEKRRVMFFCPENSLEVVVRHRSDGSKCESEKFRLYEGRFKTINQLRQWAWYGRPGRSGTVTFDTSTAHTNLDKLFTPTLQALLH